MAYLAQLNGMSGMNPFGIDTICVRPHSAHGADTLLAADSASLGLALVLTSFTSGRQGDIASNDLHGIPEDVLTWVVPVPAAQGRVVCRRVRKISTRQ